MKPISISYALARFVFLSCFTLALFTSVLVVNHVVNSINKQQDKVVKREIGSISKNLHLFLTQRRTLLIAQARYPIMLQTLMQPDANIGKIQDFMADLSILGKHYQQSLLDFQGNVLHSTLPSAVPDHKNSSWLTDIFSAKKTQYIGIKQLHDKYVWCLAVPIKYNNTIQGILTALIPIDEIYQQTSSDSRLEGLKIEILQENKPLIAFGDDVRGHFHVINWPEIGLSLRFTLDDETRNQQLIGLVIQLSLLITLAIGATTLLAYFYGYRYFVKPVLMISQATAELDKGYNNQVLNEDLWIKEFADLSTKFNHMSVQVKLREVALKQSYDQLSLVIDELKHSESQLVQSEKMASIGTLAAGVAHEINNPIGFIKSNLDILQEYTASLYDYHQEIVAIMSTEQLKETQSILSNKYDLDYIFTDIFPLLKSSLGGVERVINIVDNLKTFARIDQPEKSLCDINEGIDATVHMVWNELKYNCQLHKDYGHLPKILAYPGKLNQVFMNLLINAGQAIEDKGDVFIRTFELNHNIVVEIKDTGCGIKQENLAHIFNPFYTSKPVGQGTGLGLSISHGIILQHNGQIEVTSKPGVGSCFTIYLPLSPETEDEKETTTKITIAKKKTIELNS